MCFKGSRGQQCLTHSTFHPMATMSRHITAHFFKCIYLFYFHSANDATLTNDIFNKKPYVVTNMACQDVSTIISNLCRNTEPWGVGDEINCASLIRLICYYHCWGAMDNIYHRHVSNSDVKPSITSIVPYSAYACFKICHPWIVALLRVAKNIYFLSPKNIK